MIDQLSTVTSTAVSVALDALTQRQQLIATNLANANSSSYAIRDIDFEAAFNRVLDLDADGAEVKAALLRLKDELQEQTFVTHGATQPVQLDAELVKLNETVIRYQALIQGLGKYGSLARMAITEEVKG